MVYIDKNTILSRIRLNRREEDLVTNHNICINCDSIMTSNDYCVHCCFQYDRKPGAITGGITNNQAVVGEEKKYKTSERISDQVNE
jgi:hypothetical protein